MVLLEEIKKRLLITGNYHDELLLAHAADVKSFMKHAGVEKSVLNSPLAVGAIARGVFDIWTKEEYSQLFLQAVTQLTFLEEDEELVEVLEKSPEEIPESVLEEGSQDVLQEQ